MIKTVISIGLWAILGWACGSWLGAHAGWSIFALGLVCMILVSGWQLALIERWTANIEAPPPPSVGPWDNVLAIAYRKLRKDRHEIDSRNRHVDSIMLAAEALPDGAIPLDESMHLIWGNRMASEHLGLNLNVDRNHSIFNILRAPEFARYARQAEWPAPLLLHLTSDGHEKALLVQLTRYGLGQFLVVTR